MNATVTSLVFRVQCSFPAMVVDCENPGHKEYLKSFLKKFPSASPDTKFAIIDANPNDWWAVDLKHPENNTAKCCQMCSTTEGIRRIIQELSAHLS